ncbi:hypothetical protein DFH08DRAFT_828448 [Mycena albidolilacea]|uniref:Uncharacterized protein n=2 Tax=Mycena albidolilacea TaxID=1033008 RepID=A0AAD6YW79_9AGAR|nr:hypothetical protein DFH08DRAFT_828448 [Mycena albidolilacea]
MSSFSAFGFFALAQGKRVATYPAGATFPIHHNHYITSLKSNSDDVPNPSATLSVYSASGDAPLPDNTIAFVVAKVSAPTGKPVEMDALYLAAFPGDPNDDQYEERIPACPVFVYGVGHVPAIHTPQSHNDGSKSFTLSLTEYVSGTFKSSAVSCTYPATKRWANVPLPRSQSCTQFLGTCNGFSDSALLQIALDHVALSLGPHSITQPAADTSTDSPAAATTPARRRKYGVIGSTATPSSAAHPSTVSAAELSGGTPLPAIELQSINCRYLTRLMSFMSSNKSKRPAATLSLSSAPDDDEIDDVPEETPVKGKGKKKARH